LREVATLRSIKKEVGQRFHEGVWMVSLMIEQFRGELRWLRKRSANSNGARARSTRSTRELAWAIQVGDKSRGKPAIKGFLG